MSSNIFPVQNLQLLKHPFVFDNKSPWQWHSKGGHHYNLWICTNGQGEMTVDGQHYAIIPWTAFILSPESEVCGTSVGSEVISNFAAHWLPRGDFDGFGKRLPLGIRIRDVNAVQQSIQAMIRLSVFGDELAMQQSEWVLLNLLATIWREAQQPVLQMSGNLIHKQMGRIRTGQDLFISVDALAQEAKLSRIHYSRCFRQIAGESPNRFLIRQRVERACVLLQETDWTNEAVAESVGYNDVYFFSRQFKQVMGITAREYRLHSLPTAVS